MSLSRSRVRPEVEGFGSLSSTSNDGEGDDNPMMEFWVFNSYVWPSFGFDYYMFRFPYFRDFIYFGHQAFC